MDERIILDDEPTPGGPPLGILAAIALAALALAVIALRPSEVSPTSLGAAPPTSLHVPPQALTTTIPPRALRNEIPGLRGAIHFDVVTPEGRQLWVWNAGAAEPLVVDAPGPIDISANRRYALATTVNQAGEGVVWLGPKLDMRPAEILPGLTGAVWHRTESEWLVVGTADDTNTTFTWWRFSGVDHQPTEALTVEGRWRPVYLTDGWLGISTQGPGRGLEDERSRIIDLTTGGTVLEFFGRMWATTGPPVVYECHNLACTSSTIGWVDANGTFVRSPRQASVFPGATHIAAVVRTPTVEHTEIVDPAGATLLEVPYTGEVGAWSGDGRFFVFSKTEYGFGDSPGLVFVDTVEETWYQVRVPAGGDWFVTNIWYGP